MRPVYRCGLAFCIAVFAGAGLAQEDEPPATETPDEAESTSPADPDETTPAEQDRAELEKHFAESMSGATLVGWFTFSGQGDTPRFKDERYALGEVKKLHGDYWSMETTMEYGEGELKLPLKLQVKWAGDTPVITLDATEIPGLGTFTARVIIYGDHYSGYWDVGGVGGHMFGTIERERET